MPTIETLTVDVKANTSKLSSGLKSAGLAVAGLGAAALVTFKAFEDSEAVANQTDAVIKSTGSSANVTAGQVADLATAISNKSGIDDEAVQSGENMLLTFKNIRNEVGAGNDIFNQSTNILADMSSALGTDMKTSAIQLGKALNDPVNGITALTRVGVTFTNAQKKQIATMVKAGDTAGAQKIILAELSSEFGGSAKANKTSSMAMATAFGNLEEAIGGVAASALGPLLAMLQPVLDLMTRFPGVTAAIVVGITAVYVATKLYTVWQQRSILLNKLMWLTNPWVLLGAAVVVLTVLIIRNWTKVKAFILRVWNAIKTSAPFKVIAAVVGVYIKLIIAEIKALWTVAKLVWTAIKTVAITAFKLIVGAFKLEFGIIRTVFNVLKGALIAGWHAIRDVGVGIWDAIAGAAKAVFNAIANAWNSTVGRLSFTVPGWVPGLGGHGFDMPDIPTLAKGGLVMHTGLAVVHEGERFSGVGNGFGGGMVVHVHGSVMTERDLAVSLQKALLQIKQRSGALGLA